MNTLIKIIYRMIQNWLENAGKCMISFVLILNIASTFSGSQSIVSEPESPAPLPINIDLSLPLTTKLVTITAYSSTTDQTDDTPFVTASGERVRDGVVAANFLPFGTRIQVPSLFGEKIFTVKDRMHRRFSGRIDIWFPNRKTALRFGVKKAEILIFEPDAMSKSIAQR